jgi:ribose transport system permease protein
VPVLEVLPYPVIILVVIMIAGVWLMRSPFGRTIIATGDNPDAASLAGAHVWWVKTRAFMLSSLSATVAGILLVGYAGVHPSVGAGYEFTAITAVVLGGVVLGGGRGWLLSAAAGAFALELLFSFLNFQEVESTWRPTVQGVIIILAVAAAGRAWSLGRRPPRTSPPAPSAPPASTAPSPTSARPGTETGEI